jgi:RNA polymerase sigma-70 factor (ECF subfamily)
MIHQRAEALFDEQLMDRLGGPGLDSALSELYDRYNRTVYGVGMKILGGDHSLAEELVQDVFLKIWRSSKTFDPSRAGFSTWLYRVTRSAAIDLYRKRAHKVSQIPDGETHLLTARDSSAGPQEVVDESWLSWRVSRALEVLDASHRQVIELAYFGDSLRGRSPRGRACRLGRSRAGRRAPSRACAGSLLSRILRGRLCDAVRGDTLSCWPPRTLLVKRFEKSHGGLRAVGFGSVTAQQQNLANEFRRADERTRTADLLITSDNSAVAGACRSLQIPHI